METTNRVISLAEVEAWMSQHGDTLCGWGGGACVVAQYLIGQGYREVSVGFFLASARWRRTREDITFDLANELRPLFLLSDHLTEQGKVSVRQIQAAWEERKAHGR